MVERILGKDEVPSSTLGDGSKSFHTFSRALSSAGSERLPYKQRVGGSNPSAPTRHDLYLFWRFHLAVRIPASHAGYTGSSPVGATSLLYGVMVAREILVLLVWVRVLVQQH